MWSPTVSLWNISIKRNNWNSWWSNYFKRNVVEQMQEYDKTTLRNTQMCSKFIPFSFWNKLCLYRFLCGVSDAACSLHLYREDEHCDSDRVCFWQILSFGTVTVFSRSENSVCCHLRYSQFRKTGLRDSHRNGTKPSRWHIIHLCILFPSAALHQCHELKPDRFQICILTHLKTEWFFFSSLGKKLYILTLFLLF